MQSVLPFMKMKITHSLIRKSLYYAYFVLSNNENMPLIINYCCSEVDFMAMFDGRICLSLVHLDGCEVTDTWSSLLLPIAMWA